MLVSYEAIEAVERLPQGHINEPTVPPVKLKNMLRLSRPASCYAYILNRSSNLRQSATRALASHTWEAFMAAYIQAVRMPDTTLVLGEAPLDEVLSTCSVPKDYNRGTIRVHLSTPSTSGPLLDGTGSDAFSKTSASMLSHPCAVVSVVLWRTPQMSILVLCLVVHWSCEDWSSARHNCKTCLAFPSARIRGSCLQTLNAIYLTERC